MPGNSKIRVYCVFWVLKKALLSKPDFSDAFGRLNELDNLTVRTGHCRTKTTSPLLSGANWNWVKDLGVVVHACGPNTQETDSEALRVPELCSETLSNNPRTRILGQRLVEKLSSP